MNNSRTAKKTDDFGMWSSLIIYFVVWFFMPIVMYSWAYWYIGLIGSVAYVGSLIYEMNRGHIMLSADSTAIPVIGLASAGIALFYWLSGSHDGSIRGLYALLFAYVGGHILAITYILAVDKCLMMIFRSRIEHERAASISLQSTENRGG